MYAFTSQNFLKSAGQNSQICFFLIFDQTWEFHIGYVYINIRSLFGIFHRQPNARVPFVTLVFVAKETMTIMRVLFWQTIGVLLTGNEHQN